MLESVLYYHPAGYDAIGVRFTEMPLTPEKVLNAIKEQKARGVF